MTDEDNDLIELAKDIDALNAKVIFRVLFWFWWSW